MDYFCDLLIAYEFISKMTHSTKALWFT